MTILESILSLTVSSAVSGVIWDVIKNEGSKVIENFKETFIKKQIFANSKQVDTFVEEICTATPNSKKNPYNDVRNIYEDIVDEPNEEFIMEFKEWIEKNKCTLENLLNEAPIAQNNSFIIRKQVNSGSGEIKNIVGTVIYNN